MDMEKIMAYVEKIAENLEGLVCAIGCDSMPSEWGNLCRRRTEGELYQYQGSIKDS